MKPENHTFILDFGRGICSDVHTARQREWLVTNGLGGYASGTVAGLLTRRYHGLLVAALRPPVERTLLLTKLDETATYQGRAYLLFANHWAGGEREPDGFRHLERFHLEGATPVWSYALADALLKKRVWMQPGANTTYVRYDLVRSSGPLELSIKALLNYRDHHGNTHVQARPIALVAEKAPHGLSIRAGAEKPPFYLLSAQADAAPQHEWHYDYFLSVEARRGLDPLDDNLYAGHFQATLHAGEALTLVASIEPSPNLDGVSAYVERQEYESNLLTRSHHATAPPEVRRLVLAADQFIVRRSLPGQAQGRSVIAGYPWFADWGRDTMISLPGLTLTTGQPELAARILRTFGQYISQGMLPNHFPDAGEQPEYNTVDATLWYFEAIRAYQAATGDEALVRDLFPALEQIIAWHQRGTRYQIHLDPADGLLYAGQPGVQLTWMDAKVGDWVVTPRIGKPVEVNALWYNALRSLAHFARLLGRNPDRYDRLATRAASGFARFWNRARGYCFDVLDGPNGDDPSLRPNQLLAVSLPHSPLSKPQQRGVVDACAQHLLTSHGLRSLAPDHPDYVAQYGGDRRTRDAAYHQGTVWGWLIGPFVSAHLRVYRDRELARSFLRPLLHHQADHGVGSISEVFDGDPPFAPRGCIAQAWSVAELLRAWAATSD